MKYLFDQFNTVISKEDSLWGWLGQRGHDSIGISNLVPLHFILCCDYGSDIRQLEKRSTLLSIEKQTAKPLFKRYKWSNNDLEKMFKGSFGKEARGYFTKQKKKINLICYRSLDVLEDMAEENPERFRILASPLRLKNLFDNKIYLRNYILPTLGIKKIPGETLPLHKIEYEGLKKKWGKKFVIQFAFGSSGDHTFIIEGKEDLLKVKKSFPSQDVNITRYIDGISLNINACILKYPEKVEVVVSFPSIQIVGISEATYYPTIYCGNDYVAAKKINKYIIEEIYNITKKIGRFMASFGFKGIFGLDFLVNKNYTYVVEINPRLQNSTQLLTMCQLRKRYFPLVGLHILEFMNSKPPFKKVKELEPRLKTPIEGAQIIIYNRSNCKVRVKGSLKGGFYKFQNGSLYFVRPGISLHNQKRDGEFLLTCAVPESQHYIEKGGTLLKIQTEEEVMDKSAKRLNLRYSQITKEVYLSLSLS